MNILEGQVAIVTGGGRGIGRATALALATAGAKVAVAARSTNQLIETVQQIEQSGGHALAIAIDVTDFRDVKQMVTQVEEKLNRVFTRVARWNAVLQFDECEIFLTQRGEDLERSAIVGSFLRLLDYYQGILFLTTNRVEVLDHAVLSRVMLKLQYPDLDQAAREVIWRTMLQEAGMTMIEGTLSELAETAINGRQIRNLTRLAKILYPDGRVTLEQMRGVLTYGSASE